MSEADKLFLELGFKKVKENSYWLIYKGPIKDIDFNLKYKTIEVEDGMESKNITVPELQAINKKVEELGWNE